MPLNNIQTTTLPADRISTSVIFYPYLINWLHSYSFSISKNLPEVQRTITFFLILINFEYWNLIWVLKSYLIFFCRNLQQVFMKPKSIGLLSWHWTRLKLQPADSSVILISMWSCVCVWLVDVMTFSLLLEYLLACSCMRKKFVAFYDRDSVVHVKIMKAYRIYLYHQTCLCLC